MTPLVLVELTQAELDVGQAEPSPALACRGFLYPLVNIQIAIENGHKIVDLPIKNCDFPSFFVCLPGWAMALAQTILHWTGHVLLFCEQSSSCSWSRGQLEFSSCNVKCITLW